MKFLRRLFLIYSDQYLDWKLGAGDGSHATNPKRAEIAVALLTERLGEQAVVVEPAPVETEAADRNALDLVHTEAYIERTLSGDNYQWQGIKPIVAAAGFAMFRGTMRAVELILAGLAKVVFNPQGAKHHAYPDHSSGFCVFNDMAAAAKLFQAAGLRPLYIDWDIHAGDGVMHTLKDSGVPCISIHVSTIFPLDRAMQTFGGRGEVHDESQHRYNFNVLHGDGDEQFKQAIDAAAEIIDRYRPDVILVAAGADGHTGVGNLGTIANYTAEGFKYAADMVADKALEYAEGRVLIGGAGGYQPLVETPQTWALVVETIYNKVESAFAQAANTAAEDAATNSDDELSSSLAMKG